MRLQKQLSKKVGTKEYPKWVVVIPPEKVSEIGWREGEQLEVSMKDGKLVIGKAPKKHTS